MGNGYLFMVYGIQIQHRQKSSCIGKWLVAQVYFSKFSDEQESVTYILKSVNKRSKENSHAGSCLNFYHRMFIAKLLLNRRIIN